MRTNNCFRLHRPRRCSLASHPVRRLRVARVDGHRRRVHLGNLAGHHRPRLLLFCIGGNRRRRHRDMICCHLTRRHRGTTGMTRRRHPRGQSLLALHRVRPHLPENKMRLLQRQKNSAHLSCKQTRRARMQLVSVRTAKRLRVALTRSMPTA